MTVCTLQSWDEAGTQCAPSDHWAADTSPAWPCWSCLVCAHHFFALSCNTPVSLNSELSSLAYMGFPRNAITICITFKVMLITTLPGWGDQGTAWLALED